MATSLRRNVVVGVVVVVGVGVVVGTINVVNIPWLFKLRDSCYCKDK